MQIELGSVARILVFFVGGSLLARALIRLPLTPADEQTLLCLLVGVIPMPFFERDILQRYLAAWLTLAGACGMIWLIGDRFEPAFGHSSFGRANSHSNLLLLAFYFFLLIIGLLILRRVSKKPSKAHTESANG